MFGFVDAHLYLMDIQQKYKEGRMEMNIEELLQELKQQQKEIIKLKKENENLRKEIEEDYSDWCSIDMGAFTTNLAYTNVILTKEGSHLIKDFKDYIYEMQTELCSKILEQGEVNEDILDIIDENTYEVWNKLEDTMNIINYRGEKRQLLAKSDKFNQWLDSIEKRYGTYIFRHGYNYWLERGVDLCKPVKLSIRYYSQDKYDITNLSKHFIDYLYSNWNDDDTKKWFEVEYPTILDDDMIYWLDERRIGRSDDDYYSSRIYWKFENIDGELDVRTKADIKSKKIKDFKMKK